MLAKIIVLWCASAALAAPGIYDGLGYAAPAISHGYAAPAISHSYAAPAISHAYAAPAISHAYAAPAISHAYAAPAISHAYAAPAISHAYAAPAISHAYAAPAIAHVAPVVKAVAPIVHAEPIDPNPAYSFSYGVADPATGDHKDATETLENGVVHGSYSLVEPDGHLRKVTYTADKINGFNAVVERTGGAHAVAAPVAVAPVAKILAPAPVAVAAPVAKLTLPGIGHPWG